jgi:hypothetical protein
MQYFFRFFKWGLFSAVLAGLTVMSLSLKVRHFEGNDQLIAFEDFEVKYINDHWIDLLLIEIAETGDELPGKHLQQLKQAKLQLPVPVVQQPALDQSLLPDAACCYLAVANAFCCHSGQPPALPVPEVPLHRFAVF